MTCNCNKDRIELIVKQGTSQSYSLTIRQPDGTPVNLGSYSVEVDIKKYPLLKVKSLVSYTLDTVSSPNGYIVEPENGKIIFRVSEELSSSLNPDTYYLIVQLVNPNNRIIISGEGDRTGILKICNQ